MLKSMLKGKEERTRLINAVTAYPKNPGLSSKTYSLSRNKHNQKAARNV
jgi:hypothetical protein